MPRDASLPRVAPPTPTAEQEAAIGYYQDLLRPIFSGRKVILIGGPVAGLVDLARQVRELGADRPFILGSARGTGPLPDPDVAEWRSLEIQAPNFVEAIREYERRLADPPHEVREAIDRWDPAGTAIGTGLIFLTDPESVAGRPCYARRDPAWAALEDKARIDTFWDTLGIPRSPTKLVDATDTALRAAAACLDRGDGTVWAGDAREGLSGGALYARWVRAEEDAAEAARFFEAHCARVRVMPFLEGIPCSIHGIVFPREVSVFRPLEGITLRPRGRAGLRYCGMASFWDPEPEDRVEMRALARRVAETLAERMGYRGGFTVDGIMTENGFRPTELNTRPGAGGRMLAGALPGLPFSSILLAARAGEDLDFRAGLLEETVVSAADASRNGAGWTAVSGHRQETEVRALVAEEGGYRAAGPDEPGDAILTIGPGDAGGFVFFAPNPGGVPVGPSFAPIVVRGFEAADRVLGAGIGPLEAAREVRGRP